MKPLLTILLILFATASDAQHRKRQDPKNVLEYDFVTKTLTSGTTKVARPFLYPANADLQITIKNFNPLKYTVLLDDTAYNRFVSDAKQFGSLTAPPTSATANSSGLQNLASSCTVNPDLVSLTSSLATEITFYNNFLGQVQSIQSYYEALKLPDVLTAANIQTALTQFVNDVNTTLTAASLPVVAGSPAPLSGSIQAREQTLRNRIQALFNTLPVVKSQIEALDLSSCAAEYKAQNNQYQILVNLESSFRSTYQNDIALQFPKLMLLYDQLRVLSMSAPTFVTPAIPIDKDEAQIRLYRQEGQGAKILHDKISVSAYGGFKIDFSAGLFISGVSDEHYVRRTVDTFATRPYLENGQVRDTTRAESWTRFERDNSAKVSYGAMLYGHFYWRTGRTWAAGLHVGIGTLFNDQARWAGSAGISILLGRSQRFSINPGIVLAQVNRLSPQYASKSWYNEKLDNVPMNKEWCSSWGLGLSWNF